MRFTLKEYQIRAAMSSGIRGFHENIHSNVFVPVSDGIRDNIPEQTKNAEAILSPLHSFSVCQISITSPSRAGRIGIGYFPCASRIAAILVS